MATLSDTVLSGASLEANLAARFAATLLPSDAADFDAERLAEAARFTMRAAARRFSSSAILADMLRLPPMVVNFVGFACQRFAVASMA